MQASPLTSTVLFHLGPVTITRPVVTTWVIMLVLTAACWLVTRRLKALPDGRQAVLEIVVAGIAAQIEDVIRKDSPALFAAARHAFHLPGYGQSLGPVAGRGSAHQQA